jgi:hypothetical protein
MTAPDLLKIFMAVGILVAICGIRWLDRASAELKEEMRREREEMARDEESLFFPLMALVRPQPFYSLSVRTLAQTLS